MLKPGWEDGSGSARTVDAWRIKMIRITLIISLMRSRIRIQIRISKWKAWSESALLEEKSWTRIRIEVIQVDPVRCSHHFFVGIFVQNKMESRNSLLFYLVWPICYSCTTAVSFQKFNARILVGHNTQKRTQEAKLTCLVRKSLLSSPIVIIFPPPALMSISLKEMVQDESSSSGKYTNNRSQKFY